MVSFDCGSESLSCDSVFSLSCDKAKVTESSWLPGLLTNSKLFGLSPEETSRKVRRSGFSVSQGLCLLKFVFSMNYTSLPCLYIQ